MVFTKFAERQSAGGVVSGKLEQKDKFRATLEEIVLSPQERFAWGALGNSLGGTLRQPFRFLFRIGKPDFVVEVLALGSRNNFNGIASKTVLGVSDDSKILAKE